MKPVTTEQIGKGLEKMARAIREGENDMLEKEKIDAMFAPTKSNSNVDHPAHYNSGKIEVIDFIEDQGLDFSLGNAVKYICRAGKKDPDKIVEDLQKAIFYIQHKIDKLENE